MATISYLTRRQMPAWLVCLGTSSMAHAAPPALQLFTGSLPPFSIEGNAEQPGVLVDVTVELMARAGWQVKPEFMPWARAIQQAQLLPRALVLPLTRTAEREAQFQWLVKLCLQHFVFANLRSAPPINSLEQAKAVKVGVLRGSPHARRLAQLRFDAQRVVQAASSEDLQRKLSLQMIDAIYGSELINLYISRKTAGKVIDLQIGMTVESGEIWLAVGSGLSDDEVKRIQAAATQLAKEGIVERAFKRYGLEVPNPR